MKEEAFLNWLDDLGFRRGPEVSFLLGEEHCPLGMHRITSIKPTTIVIKGDNMEPEEADRLKRVKETNQLREKFEQLTPKPHEDPGGKAIDELCEEVIAGNKELSEGARETICASAEQSLRELCAKAGKDYDAVVANAPESLKRVFDQMGIEYSELPPKSEKDRRGMCTLCGCPWGRAPCTCGALVQGEFVVEGEPAPEYEKYGTSAERSVGALPDELLPENQVITPEIKKRAALARSFILAGDLEGLRAAMAEPMEGGGLGYKGSRRLCGIRTPCLTPALADLVERTMKTMRDRQRDVNGYCVACGLSGGEHRGDCETEVRIWELQELLEKNR